MGLIDTYELATGGQNLSNTYTLASNGVLIDVAITDLPDVVIPAIEADESGGGVFPFTPTEEKVIKHRKKITVTATIAGKKYIETKIVEEKPTLSIKDVDVKINESTNKKPVIEIKIK